MTRAEALASLHLTTDTEIEEQIEYVFFETKQKIYQQIDQVLLYPKWIKDLDHLLKIASALDVAFSENGKTNEKPFFDTIIDNSLEMLAQFNRQQRFKSQLALLTYNAATPTFLKSVLHEALAIQVNWFAFWAKGALSNNNIKLSSTFDPQEILASIVRLQEDDVLYLHQIHQKNLPTVLGAFFEWNAAIYNKLSAA